MAMATTEEYPTSPLTQDDSASFAGRSRKRTRAARNQESANLSSTSETSLPPAPESAKSPPRPEYDFDSDDEEQLQRLLRKKTKAETMSANSARDAAFAPGAKLSGARGRRSDGLVALVEKEVPSWRKKAGLELDGSDLREDIEILSGRSPFIAMSAPRYQDPLVGVAALKPLRIPSNPGRPRRSMAPPALTVPAGNGPNRPAAPTPMSAVTDCHNESDTGQFYKHPTRKGWFSCRQCGDSVWPPNGRKHTASCPWP